MSRPSLQDRVVHLDNAVHHGSLREQKISLIVMHCTEGGTAKSTIDYLNTTTDKTASYHYIIERDGTIYRMCRTNIVAYHAGDSAWPNPVKATPANPDKPNGGKSVNRESIGIAWAHQGKEILTDAQIESALWLCGFHMDENLIPPSCVVGHYEISPGRKPDPLPAMDMKEWRALLLNYVTDGAP
jgi:N-acetyl-anhydromuramyl-L-alanine amidase AmpD